MAITFNANQERANRLIATGYPFSTTTMQCLAWIALCQYDARDAALLDKIERFVSAATSPLA